MKYVKEYGISLLKFLGFLLGGSILLSLLYYFLLPTKVINVFAILYMVLVFFFFGLSSGKRCTSKGFIAGLKIGLLLLLVLILLNVLFYQSGFKIIRILYYMALLFSSVIGATIGINTQKE